MTFLFLFLASNLFHCLCHILFYFKTPKQVIFNVIPILTFLHTLNHYYQSTFFRLTSFITGKLFRGLAQQSAWTCLDEFNRIDIEVLSVVAQQLLILRQARLSGTGRCNFEGLDIAVFSMHVIITMNPGYAGRTPLPDNLKVLFRPVAMMVPDYALIAEIMLFAEGFDDASNLSRKLWDLFKLSSEQLSQQKHYDYGLRAVKSVLVMAGAAKR